LQRSDRRPLLKTDNERQFPPQNKDDEPGILQLLAAESQQNFMFSAANKNY
jgi:hypothetical protein